MEPTPSPESTRQPDRSQPPAPAEVLAEVLARALRAGDDVLGDWYAAEYPRVHRLCQGFTASRAAADDITQDAMLHLVDRIERWDPARPYSAWRNRVVLHLCRDHERAARRRERHEGQAPDPRRAEPDPVHTAAAREAEALIQRALGVLPPREREVFVLVDLEGMAAIDAAEALGVAASTVRAALAMARRRLREALAPSLGIDLATGGAS